MARIFMIGDLARETGLSIDTLNYYLRINLLDEVGRSERNGYRYFDESSVEFLERVMKLRLDKVPIKEILRRKADGIL
jgi:DNA-binding transcriptional MerR regulator